VSSPYNCGPTLSFAVINSQAAGAGASISRKAPNLLHTLHSAWAAARAFGGMGVVGRRA